MADQKFAETRTAGKKQGIDCTNNPDIADAITYL
jgi:hypothetical protein